MKSLVVKNTGKYDLEVFADEEISRRELIHVLQGNQIELSEVIARINS